MSYDLGSKFEDLGWPHVCKHTLREIMVAVRRAEAGFTITELMVVVVILSLLAAVSTPLFTRDNKAAKGRAWRDIVAQTLQRARFQAMGDRVPVHVLLYRGLIETYVEVPPVLPSTVTTFTRVGRIDGPTPESAPELKQMVAIWNAVTDGSQPDKQNPNLTGPPAEPVFGTPKPNEIIFTSLGGTLGTQSWRIYIRNELLPSAHPDASFVVNVGGLTGFVSANDKVTLP